MFMIGINGCQDNKDPVQSDSVFSIDENEKSATESLNRFKIKHDEIAMYIANNPVCIPIETWAILLENSKPISYYQLDEIFDETYFDDNGNEYKFMIELYSGSNIINPGEIRVSVDPDRFFLGSIDLSTTTNVEYDAYLHASGESLGFQKVTTSHMKNESVSYLQLFVTAEQVIYEEQKKERQRQIYTGRIPCPECTYEYYLSLVKVKVLDKRDVSNEEFEIFTRTGFGTFPSNTNLIFNGSNHYDAASRYRDFEDVNNQDYWYQMSQSVALARLHDDNTVALLLPIENDDNTGTFANFAWQSDPDTKTLETWRHGFTSNPADESHSINVGENSWVDEDDYYDSAFTRFTKSNMSQYTSQNNPLILTAGDISIGVYREELVFVE